MNVGVPKHRGTKSKRDQRRANIFLKVPNSIKCPRCGKPVLPHHVCNFCGYYKGEEIIDVMKKLTKKEKKKKEKEIAAKEESGSTETSATKRVKPLSMEELSKKS